MGGVLEIAQLNFSGKQNRIFFCGLSSPSVRISIFSHIFDTVTVVDLKHTSAKLFGSVF